MNAAIILAFQRGIVTSTSLMVIGPASEQAVRLARANPDLRVGLHLVFPHDQLELRFQGNPDSGYGRRSLLRRQTTAALRWLVQPGARHRLRRLIHAQVERFLATGLELDHLNGHHHFHVHPVVFDALLEVAEEVGVRHIRLPVVPEGRFPRSNERHLLWHSIAFAGLGLWARWLAHRLRARGFPVIDGILGLSQTGRIRRESLAELLWTLPEGTYELCVHPALNTRLGLWELQALTSPSVRRVIRERGIRLTTYSGFG